LFDVVNALRGQRRAGLSAYISVAKNLHLQVAHIAFKAINLCLQLGNIPAAENLRLRHVNLGSCECR
jgi:hypothetical protein